MSDKKGIQLNFVGGEAYVVEPTTTAWEKIAELLKAEDPPWDEMDALVDENYPPKTRMNLAALKTYLEYETLREERLHA
jgi:hypothetical protein